MPSLPSGTGTGTGLAPIVGVQLPSDVLFDPAAAAAEEAGALLLRARGACTSVPADAFFEADLAERIAAAPAWVEVLDVDQARRAATAGAQGLIARGLEGGGLVGSEAGLVLLRRILAAELGLPVLLRGGIGPDTAAAAVAIGAAGVVVDVQLWRAAEVELGDPKLAQRLDRFNPLDTRTFGVRHRLRYRVFGQVATKACRQLAELETRDDLDAAGFLAEARQLAGALPVGQDAAFAAPLAERYETVGRIVEALREAMLRAGKGSDQTSPFAPGEGVARTNGTPLPLHQGPMAQVADVAAFARAVADAGALPWLALANMPPHVAEATLVETAKACGDLPFGAGIIGMDANPHRDAHIALLERLRPPFVMVAAGTIEQALGLQRSGLATYLHTPTPGLLTAALEAGVTRVVLEGHEAGGHVGSLGGLTLWQLAIWAVERALDAGTVAVADLSVVAAGGISDAPSARAMAALWHGLHQRGVALGLQAGTAYLMTEEAVATGAVSAGYQAAILAAKQTVVMGETVGAPTRVLPTTAARTVTAREWDRRNDGLPLREQKHAFERDNLGGLRAAAKAERIASVDPVRGATFERIDDATQQETGLFHAGQAVALTAGTTTLAELHSALTGRAPGAVVQAKRDADEIVVVGLGCVLPDAPNVAAFWDNLLAGRCAIREADPSHLPAGIVYDPDRSVADRTYSRIGAFVGNVGFDRKRYRIPPRVVANLDPCHQIALVAAQQALEDAGALSDDFPREDCAVILGNSQGGEQRLASARRIDAGRLSAALAEAIDDEAAELSPAARARLLERFQTDLVAGTPPICEDTMPGELPNCIAGRVAGTFDLGGPSWIVDAACASTLAAMQVAVEGLLADRYKAALVGGADRMMGPESYVKFSKIGALSAVGSRPFDEAADGFVMGEGAAAMVLMRRGLADSLGLKVYAVVKGIGGSSDGRGKSITAPNPRGQARAVERAYHHAGVDPKTVTMIEAHGTGTAVGDRTEVGALVDTVGRFAHGASLGSVKSNIGHLKAAAAGASLLKAVLCLHHQRLVPTLGVTTLNPALPLSDANLTIQTRTEAWAVPAGVPRRVGVSAFGFGGANVHAVLEEAAPALLSASVDPEPRNERRGWDAIGGVVVLGAASRQALLARVQALRDALDDPKLNLDLLRPDGAEAKEPHRVAIAFDPSAVDPSKGHGGLADGLSRAAKVLETGRGERLARQRGVFLGEGNARGRMAFLFPGQGSQYLGMIADLASAFPVVAETLALADEVMAPVLDRPLSSYVNPELAADDTDGKGRAFEALTRTEITQPAVLAADAALHALLRSLGYEADVVAGHSLGEYGACVAAGVMDLPTALRTVAQRGTAMASVRPADGDNGRMLAVAASAEVCRRVLKTLPGYAVCANENCPTQTVVGGSSVAIEAAAERFAAQGIDARPLPVSHAFHTQVVAPACEPLTEHLRNVTLNVPGVAILSNVTGDYYPTDREAIVRLLGEQVAAPVRYIAMVERMYADGVRTFVEIGPKRAQTGFVSSTLGERPHAAIATNHPKPGGLTSLRCALAELAALGHRPHAGAHAHAQPDAQNGAQNGAQTMTDPSETPPAPEVAHQGGVYETLLELLCDRTGYDADEIEPDFELEADLGVDTVKQAEIMSQIRAVYGMERDPDFRLADFPTLAALAAYVTDRTGATVPVVAATATATAPPAAPPAAPDVAVYDTLLELLCDRTGYDADEIEPDFELEADLGVDTVKQAEIMGQIRSVYGLERDPDFRLAEFPTLATLAEYVVARLPEEAAPAVSGPEETAPSALDTVWEHPAEVVCTGLGAGIPGSEVAFEDGNLDRLLSGDNLISELPNATVDAILAKNITRLRKAPSGEAVFEPVSERSEAVGLAGRLGRFSLAEFGLPERYSAGLDRASQLAIAAGLEAMRDAGLPLVPQVKTTKSGRQLVTGWALPPSMRDDTGVVFASAFAGVDVGIDHAHRAATDPDFAFDGRFVLQSMGMGHARMAEIIGARGPNTRVNAACASFTQALGLAADWLQLGRCRRVIVIAADDVTDETMMPWVGSGFLASGAATTERDVSRAALPFDRRRSGTILGAGATAAVLETAEAAAERGVVPYADHLGTDFACSAFHTTRLDVDHLADRFGAFVSNMGERWAVSHEDLARRGVFVSHETFTPARGGSAEAEIAMVRRTFGEDSDQLVIANTKGYTGHIMGAGFEDVLAPLMLQRQVAPAIANLTQPDEELGSLRFSDGTPFDADYAFRFAAGFGGQLAIGLWRRRSRCEQRFIEDTYGKWLQDVTGEQAPVTEVVDRVLRLVKPARPPKKPAAHDPGRFGSFGLAQVRATTPRPLSGRPQAVTNRRVAVLGDGDTATRVRAHLAAAGAHVVDQLVGCDGVVAAFDASETPESALATLLARAQAHTGTGSRWWLTLVSGGGTLGRDTSPQAAALIGTLAGFTKSLDREWPDVRARFADVASLDAASLDAALDAALRTDSPREFGVTAAGLQTLDTVAWSPVLTSPGFGPTTTWLVSGGARGITARVVEELAKRFGGGRFLLTGRTSLDRSEAQALALDLGTERRAIRQRLSDSGERVTPARLDRELRGLFAAKEIATTLATLRRLGARASYLAFDVADRAAVHAALAGARSVDIRSVDVCIHAAGLEDSRNLADKTAVSVAQTLAVKLDGARNLFDALSAVAAPALFVGFTSISGRFGNAGQVDYAAANDALARWLTALDAAPGNTRALAIDWTAWADVGMATRGSVATVLEGLGVELMPPEIGAALAADLIAGGARGEVVAAGRLGALSEPPRVDAPESAAPAEPLAPVAPAAPAAPAAIVETHPVFDGVVRHDSAHLTATITLDPTQPFLADHAIDGVPILPGVITMELFAQAAQLLSADGPTGFTDVRFERPLKLHRGRTVTAEVVAELGADGVVACTLSATRELAGGRTETNQYAQALVTTGPNPAAVSPWPFEQTGAGAWHPGLTRAEVYEAFFHTGVFRVLDEVSRTTHSGLAARGRISTADLGHTLAPGLLLSDPLCREMGLQAAGLLGLVADGTTYLPAAIGRVTVHARANAGEPVIVRAVARPDHDPGQALRRFDVEMRSAAGRLLQRLVSCDVIAAGAPRHPVRDVLSQPTTTWTRELSAAQAEAWLEGRDQSIQGLCTPAELGALYRLKSQDRRREWVAARVTLKTLVSEYVLDACGSPLPPEGIEILKGEFGAPRVEPRAEWAGCLAASYLPAVSISHSAGVALAAISPGPGAIGVDLEAIASRGATFADDYLDATELSLPIAGATSDAALHTALWSIKEAATKALGLGLHVAMSEIRVSSVDADGNASLVLSGVAEHRLRKLGGAHIEATVQVGERFVRTKARLIPDANSHARSHQREAVLAAVAALLREKGLLGTSDPDGASPHVTAAS